MTGILLELLPRSNEIATGGHCQQESDISTPDSRWAKNTEFIHSMDFSFRLIFQFLTNFDLAAAAVHFHSLALKEGVGNKVITRT
ncbi:MAG: hypothetical protein LBE81_08665 [Azonexus sp.]|jgi:hypothetical protein|uniref:hypothetical protein n=1 Tax=Azonexus sp. TaxID=1872668 RepID=UPI00282E5DFA|nr:hypothetical protein [Azonexus sp.]MDR0776694.1 hypothetical protein [Azonexus sp.]